MVHQVDSSSAAAPVVHLPPGLDAVEAMGRVEGYDSPDYDSADVEELTGRRHPATSPSRRTTTSCSSSAQTLTTSVTTRRWIPRRCARTTTTMAPRVRACQRLTRRTTRCARPTQYRRIAVDCANAVLLGQDATVAPPAEGEGVDAAIYNYCATANASDMYSQGSTWTSVSAGEDPAREAAHWKEVAEQGFRESARLRAMVQALRATFDEVEEENE